MPSVRTIAGFGLLAASLAARARRGPRIRSVEERLAMLPRDGLPLRRPVAVHWNDRQVPIITAEHDADAAVALGLVHGHLRLAQLEIMRRIAAGRLAESIGPAAVDLDRVVRCLDIGRSVAASEAALPEDLRRWLDGFVAGLNRIVADTDELPVDLDVLGIRPEPWSVTDVLLLSRLAALDFTWKVWRRLFKLRGRADWMRQWQRLMGGAAAPVPSFAGGDGDLLGSLLFGFGRHGSNSVAVAGRHSAGGSALIASDPHLQVLLPNLWLIAGVRSPGYCMAGLMVPGIPAMALGRNPWIAWGGTSLHAASSELFDVSDLPASEITARREKIAVRWWPDVEITVRDTAYGPIVTDAPLLGSPPHEPLALHWIGHTEIDDVGALLRMNRARDWEGFRRALDGFAVPAQNMVYADAAGHVGQIMAAKLPRRPPAVPEDMVVPRAARRHWESFATGSDLPSIYDPPEGFVASANNRPTRATAVAISWFFSPDDRVRRLAALLGQGGVTVERLKALQQDVFMPSALELRDLLVDLAAKGGVKAEGAAKERLWTVLRAWDGTYEVESVGALALELLIFHFVHALHGPEELALYEASWEPWALLREDLATLAPERLAKALEQAQDRAAQRLRRHADWGSVHRLRLNHVLAAAPVVGARFRFGDIAWGGGNETVMKAAHGFAGGRHSVRLGAIARHVSDMGDLDANWFCLLGGQDGWIGGAAFVDQLPLWRRGEYVQVPLRPETIAGLYRHRTDLSP